MKRILIAGAALAAFAVSPAIAEPPAAPKCLHSINIKNTTVPNDRTILFQMNNGTVWRNDLRNSCPDLKFYGFIYVATPPDDICGDVQSIRVIHTGAVCLLGPFSLESMPAEHH